MFNNQPNPTPSFWAVLGALAMGVLFWFAMWGLRAVIHDLR